ncbi:MAG: S1 family peptidase [Pseudonocardiaceae bacterium]
MLARTLPRVLSATAFVVLLSAALAVPSSATAASDVSSSAAASSQILAAQRHALLREAGLSVRQAEQRLAEEAATGDAIAALRKALGSSFAGAWFESGSTDLVVATTDRAALPRVRAAGMVPRLVARDLLTLNRVMAVLDSRAGRVPDAVTGWYVDPSSNSVVVSATDLAAAEDFAAGLEGVRVKQVYLKPRPLGSLYGGDGIEAGDGGRCSIGFNATSGATRYIITAGHCTKLGGIWSAQNGSPIGPVAQTSFPDNDFGLIEVTSPFWTQTSGVNTSNGHLTLTGADPVPVGASICRSGSTTGWQCGTVEAVDQTINYGGGDVVNGLTRTDTCAEPGDSGGPFVSGSQAQGMLSGGAGSCFINLFGAETYFQPVAEVLWTYHLTLLTGRASGSD